MSFKQDLGGLLGSLRERSGVSQEALAVQLRHDQSYVSRIEAGERQISILLLLQWCDALNLEFVDVTSRILNTWRGEN